MAWLALIIKCCINLLESSSDFCQCNRKSIELSEDEMDDGKKSMTGLHNVESFGVSHVPVHQRSLLRNVGMELP